MSTRAVDLTVMGLERFVADPRDGATFGEGWVVWQLGRDFAGTIVFGRLRADEVSDHYRAIAATAMGSEPVSYVSDVSRVRLGTLDPALLREAAGQIRKLRPALERGFKKSVVWLPEGVIGALVGGFVAVYDKTAIATYVGSRREEIAAWLDVASYDAVVARLRVLAPALDGSELVTRALEVLEAHPDLDIEATARRVGVSRRTLQRAIATDGTTFRALAVRARVRIGAGLLAAGLGGVADVAARLGFRSARDFERRFRELMGRPPTGPR